jgi:hypothetical protein
MLVVVVSVRRTGKGVVMSKSTPSLPTLELDHTRDPLRVLASTLPLVQDARAVRIVPERVAATADLLADQPDTPPDWSAQPQLLGRDEAERANLVLALDALNFCFWSVPNAPRPRWQVTYAGQTHDGYWALVAALERAIADGRPLADATYLATLTEVEVAELLAGDPGTQEIPLLHARLQHLREVGRVLLARWDGSFVNAIEAAKGSAATLVHEVYSALTSFHDISLVNGHEARFLKRAQILVADLVGAFGGRGPGAFHDLPILTAFADYKVPQVLRRFGVLEYTPPLAARVARHELLPPDSPEELEIRATTIWGVELLRRALLERGRDLPSYRLDWALWQAGQSLPADAEPYHRTLTVFY